MEVSQLFLSHSPLTPGLRHDARRPYELRTLSLELGTHPASDGSATVSQGLTTVQCSVFGPKEAKQRANTSHDKAGVVVEVGVAPWAGAREVRRTRGDKWVASGRHRTILIRSQTSDGNCRSGQTDFRARDYAASVPSKRDFDQPTGHLCRWRWVYFFDARRA